MIYRFDEFELDTLKVELRHAGETHSLEPQVFMLLCLLVENADRLVSKDEIVEKVWDGRVVSDSAVASRIKSLRAALGDNGKTQRLIRTMHGQGFRFVGEVKIATAAPRRDETPGPEAAGERHSTTNDLSGKPSIAVLPFRLVGIAGAHAGVADALPDELISVLARLRWLFVIARGTAFRFRPPEQDVTAIGGALGVGYCLTGAIEVVGEIIIVAVGLAETKRGGVIWGERFKGKIDDIHTIREEIIMAIVAALEVNIPLNEANAARLKSPDRLDAWSAYHLGVHHIHRFNARDNEAALAMFEKAIGLDPSFARAHAGLSSAHFQNAFLRYKPDRTTATLAARRYAERSVELDPLDPMVNFAMGRVYWIENDIPAGIGWLDRSVSLSPNYAQGIYARAWANTITDNRDARRSDIDLALSLSPLDPFRYAMLGVRGLNYFADGDLAAAARWADESARAPGAHVLIAAIAVAINAIAGNDEQAQRWADNVRKRNPELRQAHFFEAFPYPEGETRGRLSAALTQYGF